MLARQTKTMLWEHPSGTPEAHFSQRRPERRAANREQKESRKQRSKNRRKKGTKMRRRGGGTSI
jgi:hypothetical protein